jgi:TatD DNase family protein
MNPLIDSHAHLTSQELYPQLDAMIERAVSTGVQKIINICTDADTLDKGLLSALRYPSILYNAGSTTPHDVDKEGEMMFNRFAEQARNGKLIAVGETGLDYHYTHSKPETQKYFLKRYLQLALECQLPVIIHCREAFTDFFDILDAEYKKDGKHASGVLHCFTGTVAEAEQVIARGWYLSLSGIVTFKKSDTLREVAKMVPLDQLLIETDAPYLAPQSHRGQQNEPAFLPETAALIAAVKNIPLEKVAQATYANATKLFTL